MRAAGGAAASDRHQQPQQVPRAQTPQQERAGRGGLDSLPRARFVKEFFIDLCFNSV